MKGYYFRSSITEALARNDRREGKARLPKPALLSTHSKLELPVPEEGFDALYYVSISADSEFYCGGIQECIGPKSGAGTT